MNAEPLPDPAHTRGIDVSHYQGVIPWDLVAQAGMTFAFIKATEGTSSTDPRFQANWDGAQEAELLRGAYHFYHPNADPHQQAKRFLSVVQTGPKDLPPVLDVETHGKPSDILAGIQTWLDVVEQEIGRTPILYTNPSFWKSLGPTLGFYRYYLWIAEYGVATPRTLEGLRDWSFWQFSESGSIPGIEGKSFDLDVFHGTLSDLRQWVQSQS